MKYIQIIVFVTVITGMTVLVEGFILDTLFGHIRSTTRRPAIHLPTTATTTTATTSGHPLPHPDILDRLADKECPQHLQRTNTLMYNQYTKHCFQINVDKRADWNSAQRDCQQLGGHLAVIENWSDNSFIGFRSHAALAFHKDHHLWIGLRDKENNGEYKWITGSSLSYTSWDLKQPHDVWGDNCVSYNRDTDKWAVSACSNQYAWICQYAQDAKQVTALNSTLPSTHSKSMSTHTNPHVSPTLLIPTTTLSSVQSTSRIPGRDGTSSQKSFNVFTSFLTNQTISPDITRYTSRSSGSAVGVFRSTTLGTIRKTYQTWHTSKNYNHTSPPTRNPVQITTNPATNHSAVTSTISTQNSLPNFTHSLSSNPSENPTTQVHHLVTEGECPSCKNEMNISKCSSHSEVCRGSQACYLEFTSHGANAGCFPNIAQCYRTKQHFHPECGYRPIPFHEVPDIKCAYCCDITKHNCFGEFLSLVVYDYRNTVQTGVLIG